MATIADSIPNEECFTVGDIATEFGISEQRARQVVEKAIKSRMLPNITKKDGRRILYAPQMVDELRELKEKGKLGKFRSKMSATSLKHAELVVSVPIFDKEIAELLMRKFKTNEAIAKFVKDKLEESVKPILAKKRELIEKYEAEMAKLLSTTELSM